MHDPHEDFIYNDMLISMINIHLSRHYLIQRPQTYSTCHAPPPESAMMGLQDCKLVALPIFHDPFRIYFVFCPCWLFPPFFVVVYILFALV